MEVCIQTGKLVYKYGVLLTKESFYLQRGTLALQTGNSKFNFPLCSYPKLTIILLQ